MSKKRKKQQPDKIAAKKAAVLNPGEKNRMPLFLTLVGVILIAGAAAFFVYENNNKQTAIAIGPSTSSSTTVTFPTALFQDGKARHFEHVSGNFTVRYFLLYGFLFSFFVSFIGSSFSTFSSSLLATMLLIL